MTQYLRDESRLRNGNHNLPRWGAIVSGGALAAFGISRRSKTGAALAAAGGLLALGGSRISSEPQELHAEASFTINVSPKRRTASGAISKTFPALCPTWNRFVFSATAGRNGSLADRSKHLSSGPLKSSTSAKTSGSSGARLPTRSSPTTARYSSGALLEIVAPRSLLSCNTSRLRVQGGKPLPPCSGSTHGTSFVKICVISNNCLRPAKSLPRLASLTDAVLRSSRQSMPFSATIGPSRYKRCVHNPNANRRRW